jgi:hypothetical protein
MTMYKTGKRGSSLVLVLIAATFLIILTGALYTYLKSNVDTQIWTRDMIQAKFSAEAGLNLATHMLVVGAELPSMFTPQPILGTPLTFADLPGGMGSVFVSVDPNDDNEQITSANAYLLRCIAEVPGESVEFYGMEAIVMPENLARFSVFMDDPSLDGYYGDGYRFDGPFYANGPVCIYSSSATHENDPFFYSLHLTSTYYVYGQNSGGSHETTPAAGNLQMQPYNRLMMGAPYFELGIDPIPFGPDELDWEGVRNAAQNGGLNLTTAEVRNGSRLLLTDSLLTVKYERYGAETVYDLSSLTNPVVWIENGNNDRVYLKGHNGRPFDMALTIGMMGDLYMAGDLKYANRDLEDPENDNLLGLMTVYGDILIADDVNGTGEVPGWVGFEIATHQSFEYDAVLVSLSGVLEAENHRMPLKKAEFLLLGGYMIQEEGYTGTPSEGFDISVYFDPRLLSRHPPFFPTTANWLNIMWRDKPNITVRDVEEGRNPEY